MTEQTKAMRLADELDAGWCPVESPRQMAEAAAELRRLSTVNTELLEALNDMLNAEYSYPYGGMSESEIAAIEKAHAAIARAKE